MTFDLATLALLWLGGSIVLLPLMILAIRFAVVPLVATILRPAGASRASSDSARIASLEEKVGRLALELDRLARATSAQPNG